MKSKILYIVVMCVLCVAAMTSCNEEEAFEYGDFCYDMVTYEGDNGERSVFSYQAYDDSPLVTLTASNMNRPGMVKGQRLLLNYIVENDLGDNTKVVEVKGFSKVTTDTIEILPQAELDGFKSDEVKVKSVWRTGNYINVRCMLEYTEKPRRLFLATSGIPGEDGIVPMYQIQDLMGAQTFYWLETYLSYYIAPVWEKEDVAGVRYNAVDLSWPEAKYYDFMKY